MSEPVKDVREEKKDEKASPREDKAAELTKYKVRRRNLFQNSEKRLIWYYAADCRRYCAPGDKKVD